MDDVRFSKLPKWAQAEIQVLRQRLEAQEKRTQRVANGDTEVWIKKYLGTDEPLPPGSTITFKLPNGKIHVRRDSKKLLISTDFDTIAFCPTASHCGSICILE